MAHLKLASGQAGEPDRAFADLMAADDSKPLLRLLTCGSVDDGKSTLIGRLLYDSRLIFEDQLDTLRADSKRQGTTGGDLDLALLVDGLQAEREQGITIDVAYRYFATPNRKFIVADCPGHEQYTRNMATGASGCDVALILVDARKGVLTQTRRHATIVSLLGLRHIVLAVNKMDLAGYDKARFEAITADFEAFAKQLDVANIASVPISARTGENVLEPSANMQWHHGPTLMAQLETIDLEREGPARPLRFPVQWVNRQREDFRGFAGTLAGGSMRPGDKVVALPSGRESRIARIVTYDGDLEEAVEGNAVTVTLTDEIDISRGDVLAAPETRPQIADQLAAQLVWLGEQPMLSGRSYLIRCGQQVATATVTELKYKLNVDTLEHLAGKTLELNDIGTCTLAIDRPLVFDPYADNRDMGGFILIDRLTNATVGAGMIAFGLRRAENVHWQALDIDKAARASLKGQKPCVLWFTGLSGSGKSTIANLLEKRLHAAGRHTYILDGDNVRHGLNKDLGFTEADRVENIRRVGETAKLLVDAGLIVMVSFISPFRAERRMARRLFEKGEFLEVFVDAPLEICEERDPKGLYAKARAGAITNFTGLDSPYEPPERADIHLEAGTQTAEDLVDGLWRDLTARGVL